MDHSAALLILSVPRDLKRVHCLFQRSAPRPADAISSLGFQIVSRVAFLKAVPFHGSQHFNVYFSYLLQTDQKLRVCDICGAFLSIFDRWCSLVLWRLTL